MKTTEEMIAVMQAYVDGKRIEWSDFHSRPWLVADEPVWNWVLNDYRIAVTKPSIDWSHVAKKYKWLSTDKNGVTWIYDIKPVNVGLGWGSTGSMPRRAEHFASFRPGTCSWEDSLVERPEGE